MTDDLINYFNQRSKTYNQSEFHQKFAQIFVEYSQIKLGQKVLDLATGTGLVALKVAQIIGQNGEVMGVDLSKGMLDQAQIKINQLGLQNIQLILGNAENIDLPQNYFDRVLCCSSLHYFSHLDRALKNWYQFLKKDGLIVVSGFSTKAFNLGIIIRNILAEYGIYLADFNEMTANGEKCYQLLKNAGFNDVTIKTEQLGSYLSLTEGEKMWDNMVKNPLFSGIEKLTFKQQENARQKYHQLIKKLLTPQGIWNDTTTFFILGKK